MVAVDGRESAPSSMKLTISLALPNQPIVRVTCTLCIPHAKRVFQSRGVVHTNPNLFSQMGDDFGHAQAVQNLEEVHRMGSESSDVEKLDIEAHDIFYQIEDQPDFAPSSSMARK